MQIWNIAAKDILQILKDRRTLFFLILMPLIFTLFLGLLMSGSGSSADNRLPLGILDQDSTSVVSTALRQALQSSPLIRVVDLNSSTVSQAQDQVASGTLAGLLTIPDGFSTSALAGKTPSLVLSVDPKSTNGQIIPAVVSTALARVNSAIEIAIISAEEYAKLQPFADQAARLAYLGQSVTSVTSAWQNAPLSLATISGTAPTTTSGASPNPYSQSSPGMIVQFSIYGLMFASGILVTERNNRTLQRLLTTPIARWEIVAGHVFSTFLVIMVQETILIAVGQIAFKVDYLRQPGAILLMMAAVAIWGASLGLLIGVISKREEHTVLWSLVAMFLLAGLGGAWFPLDVTGQTFSTIGHLTPSAWAMDGFQNIIQRGLGFSSVLLPTGILLAYTILFGGIALWRFKMAPTAQ